MWATFLNILNQFHITIMEFRNGELISTLQGYKLFKIPLVNAYTTTTLHSTINLPGVAGITDDLGIYAFIPNLAYNLHLNITQAITLFYMSIYLLAFILGAIGCFYYFHNLVSKIIATLICAIIIIYTYQSIGDVYSIACALTIGVLPLFMAITEKSSTIKMQWFLILILIVMGLLLGVAGYIRNGSSLPVFIFMLFMLIISNKYNYKIKIFGVLALLVGISLVMGYFHHIIKQRDNYITQHNPNFDLNKYANAHPLWHTAYIGLGYLPNPYGINYADGVGMAKAISIDPKVKYMTNHYNNILKAATVSFIKQHPKYMIKLVIRKFIDSCRIVFAIKVKMGTWKIPVYIFLYLGLILLIINLIANRNILIKYLTYHVAFILGLFSAILPGLIAIPSQSYLAGFITLAYLYSAFIIDINIDSFMKMRNWKEIKLN